MPSMEFTFKLFMGMVVTSERIFKYLADKWIWSVTHLDVCQQELEPHRLARPRLPARGRRVLLPSHGITLSNAIAH